MKTCPSLPWDDPEPLSEAILRARFGPPKYRVSASRYPAGTVFRGAAAEAACYVLAGRIHIAFQDVEFNIDGGAYAKVPAGEFTMSVVGPTEAQVATVWDVEAMIKARNDPNLDDPDRG